jgi:hypothetical protein
MALDSNAAFTNTNSVAFPDNEAVNASGGAATDGTEFVKLMVDNYMFGRQQALLNFAGLTPSGSSEADGASQELEAMQKGLLGQPAGTLIGWLQNDDPATFGARALLLTGQGILRANYVDLDNAVYVGDGNNATAPAFFRADNSDGTSRNTTGIYLILPDARAMFWRGTGTHGTLTMADSNFYSGPAAVGGSENDQMQAHQHVLPHYVTTSGSGGNVAGTGQPDDATKNTNAYASDSFGTPRTGDETRPVNLGIRWAINY